MDYFLYISDTKLDMLVPQIPEKAKGEIAAEIGINVGILKATLKSEQKVEPRDNSIAKTQLVSSYIRKSFNVGTIDEPTSWIEDVQNVQTLFLKESNQVVFFVGRTTKGTRFALGGSVGHLISEQKSDKVEIGWSFLPRMMEGLKFLTNISNNYSLSRMSDEIPSYALRKFDEFEWMELLRVAQKIAPGPHFRVKFLARTLLCDKHPYDHSPGIVATPIYVAMA